MSAAKAVLAKQTLGQEEPAPLGLAWGQIYSGVLTYLLILIVLLFVFTHLFS